MRREIKVNILSRELREILRFLLNTVLTQEDFVFLETHFPEPWADFSKDTDWDKKHTNDMWEVNERITEILDAKKRELRGHFYTDGLSTEDASEIAEICKIEVPSKIKKRKIIRMILKEIRKRR